MIVRFRLGNITETRPVHGKLDHHVSAGRKRDGYKQLPVSVEFPKYGNTLFRPVGDPASPLCFHENPAFRTTVDVRRSKKLLLKLPIGDRTKRIKQETPRGVALHYNQNKFEWIPLTGKQSNPVYPVNVSRIPDCILVKSRILGIPFPNRYENYPLRQALSNFEREIYRLDLGVSL